MDIECSLIYWRGSQLRLIQIMRSTCLLSAGRWQFVALALKVFRAWGGPF